MFSKVLFVAVAALVLDLSFAARIAKRASDRQSASRPTRQIDGVSACKNLAQQIGQEIQDPNTLDEHKIMSKFTNLIGVVRSMNAKQLESATNELYYAQDKASSSDATKLNAWRAYRDAVAEAGTGPALITMKKWIESGKVKGEEATELLAVPHKSIFQF